MDKFVDLIASGFHTGKIPIASGTWGTLLAMVLIHILYLLAPEMALLIPSLILAFATLVLAIWAANYVCAHSLYGENNKDPKQVVIDEIAGYFFAVAGLGTSYLSLISAFFFFRFFDILKPFPIRNLERLPNGYGIVLDDILAGIFSNILARLLFTALVTSLPV